MEQSNNPLSKYFRASVATTKVPSNGKFQSEGNLAFTATGEVAVMAMRAADEMLLKSPDALMSGMAIEQLLKSCVPGLKDVHQLPSPDVDTLLLAIRSATYGPTMHVDMHCPSCEAENSFAFDITAMLDTITPLENEYAVRLNDDLVIYMRPFNFKSNTRISTTIFQETKKIKYLEETAANEDAKQHQTNESFKKLQEVSMQMLADSVEKIATPDGVITNREHINGFMANVDVNVTALLEKSIREINQSGLDKNQPVHCHKCEHEWKAVVEFDPESFFGDGS